MERGKRGTGMPSKTGGEEEQGQKRQHIATSGTAQPASPHYRHALMRSRVTSVPLVASASPSDAAPAAPIQLPAGKSRLRTVDIASRSRMSVPAR